MNLLKFDFSYFFKFNKLIDFSILLIMLTLIF